MSARIRMTAAMAADGRDLAGLRARLDDFKIRVSAPVLVLRSVS